MQTKTFNRIALTLVEVMIVVAITGLLAVVTIQNFIKARDSSQKHRCINNLSKIRDAKIAWALAHKKDESDTPQNSDLFGPNAHIKESLVCPAKGTYILGTVAAKPTCSITGHTL